MTGFARLVPPLVALVLQAVSGHAQSAGPATREGYFDAGGIRLYYRVAGSAPDTLVVLHGGPGFTLEYLADDLLPLADRHTLIFYDQRGTGRSTLVRDSASLDGQRFAEDLEAVRRHFRLERVALLGHSWGAGVAALYAGRYPERIGRMIIVGGIPLQRSLLSSAFDALAAGRDSSTRRQMQHWREARLANPGDAAACRAYYVLWFTPFFVDPMAARRSKGDFCAGSPESLRNKVQSVDRFTMASLGEWDWRPSLRSLKAPVLVIHGSRDVLPLEGARGWVSGAPDARLLLLEDVGHFPYLEAPERFFTAVHEFLGGGWPAAAAANNTAARPDGQDARPKTTRDPLAVSEPHEKMSFFEGTWSMEPGAWFKGGGTGPSKHEETCAWLPGGRRHLVCRSWSLRGADTVRREAVYILSYQEHDSTYLARFAFPAGATLTYIGRMEGDRWIMDMQQSPLLPPNERFRTIITKVGTGLRFVEEHSVDGGPWSVTEDYRYRRVR